MPSIVTLEPIIDWSVVIFILSFLTLLAGATVRAIQDLIHSVRETENANPTH